MRNWTRIHTLGPRHAGRGGRPVSIGPDTVSYGSRSRTFENVSGSFAFLEELTFK